MKKISSITKSIQAKFILIGLVLLIIFKISLSHGTKDGNKIIKNNLNPNYDNGRIIQTKDTIYRDRNSLYIKKQKNISDKQEILSSEVDELKQMIKDLSEKNRKLKSKSIEPVTISPEETADVKFSQSKLSLEEDTIKRSNKKLKGIRLPSNSKKIKTRDVERGMIVFPVKRTSKKNTIVGVDIPRGSYVKGTVLAGARVAQGKTIPFLIQLDEVYILPNNKWIDLSGCFVIAKGEADLSTERLELQPDSISCVNKRNEMFESQITGWAVDEKDNNFALDAKLISKRGRVATAAFLASLVSGIGKSIKQAQTTQIRTPLGGRDTDVTGNQEKYLAGGAATESASLVTQWYLEQARSLLPTLEVGSSRNIWLVMSKSFRIPSKFLQELNKDSRKPIVFRKNRNKKL